MPDCFRPRPDGIDLFVRLTPKSASDGIDGVGQASDGSLHLAARVRALPDKGAANAALERLIADRLGVARSAVRIASGAASRLKTVRIAGEPAALARALEAALAHAASKR